MMTAAREVIDCDVVIVGAGVAGLATAISLAQRAQAAGQAHHIIVLEKAARVGGHILSGAVIDPIGLDILFPQWRNMGGPLQTQVRNNSFQFLTHNHAFTVPHWLLPRQLRNDGCYIGSLGALTVWLAEQAQALGVEIYAGFPAAGLLYNEHCAAIGVITADSGRLKDGTHAAEYMQGVAIHAKYTVLAEGVRGSVTKRALRHFDLLKDASFQQHGIGFKEIWEIPAAQHRAGHVVHSIGRPLKNNTGGGGFMYHYGANLVAVGYVVHLNYTNPHLDPFQEFQRYKTHPSIAAALQGGQRIAYGARAISEGGWQSVPRLTFPGGALVGCAAGFMNVPRIKGSHNAMLSGIACAAALHEALSSGRAHDELSAYEDGWRAGPIGQDLYSVRNAKPLWSRFGTLLGMMFAGADMWVQRLCGASLFGTLKHQSSDSMGLKHANMCPKIEYPQPDGVLSFDRASSIHLANLQHNHAQPDHLKLRDASIPIEQNLPLYDEPAQRYCPAGVYEIVQLDGVPQLQINAQNCIHCKTCDIKDPAKNITWMVPEGGSGPNYVNM